MGSGNEINMGLGTQMEFELRIESRSPNFPVFSYLKFENTTENNLIG